MKQIKKALEAKGPEDDAEGDWEDGDRVLPKMTGRTVVVCNPR